MTDIRKEFPINANVILTGDLTMTGDVIGYIDSAVVASWTVNGQRVFIACAPSALELLHEA